MSVFQKQYRQLSEAEKEHVERIKTIAEHLYAELQPGVETLGPRELALARTKLEECVMWAVKGITG